MKLIALVGAGLLLMTGCAADSDSRFIAQLEETAPVVLQEGTAEQAVKLAHVMCDSMDDGASAYDQASTMEAAGFGVADSGHFVIAAVDAYCPEHASKVR